MSHKCQSPAGAPESPAGAPESVHAPESAYDPESELEPGERPGTAARLADLGDRIARALASFDRGRVARFALGQDDDCTIDFPTLGDDEGQSKLPSRFPVGPLGYSRSAVDERIAELERELDELRRPQSDAPISITEEIERLGEQTASILVVAHDQAHETARLAREHAERCVTDAATNAVAITEQAKQQLHELDNETDAVWRERRRLIEDLRTTGDALIALATEAADRFPEESKTEPEPADTPPG